MFKLILLTIAVVAVAVVALGVKMFLVKGGTFTKTCSSIDAGGEKIGCSCKDKGEDKCENYEKHHGKDKEV